MVVPAARPRPPRIPLPAAGDPGAGLRPPRRGPDRGRARLRVLKGNKSGGQLLAAGRGPCQVLRRGQAQLLIGHSTRSGRWARSAAMPVELRDGRLYGARRLRHEGGLVQGIFALRALRELGLEPPLAPAFFINSDEEIGSGESRRASAAWPAACGGSSCWSPRSGPRAGSRPRARGSGASGWRCRAAPRTPASIPRRGRAPSWSWRT